MRRCVPCMVGIRLGETREKTAQSEHDAARTYFRSRLGGRMWGKTIGLSGCLHVDNS